MRIVSNLCKLHVLFHSLISSSLSNRGSLPYVTEDHSWKLEQYRYDIEKDNVNSINNGFVFIKKLICGWLFWLQEWYQFICAPQWQRHGQANRSPSQFDSKLLVEFWKIQFQSFYYLNTSDSENNHRQHKHNLLNNQSWFVEPLILSSCHI